MKCINSSQVSLALVVWRVGCSCKTQALSFAWYRQGMKWRGKDTPNPYDLCKDLATGHGKVASFLWGSREGKMWLYMRLERGRNCLHLNVLSLFAAASTTTAAIQCALCFFFLTCLRLVSCLCKSHRERSALFKVTWRGFKLHWEASLHKLHRFFFASFSSPGIWR